ncbi:MAG TPA: hypothetical protein VME17_12275 [Bryobacteraceae bacterium]|nr:hypothetical protein [Bryobacteraceae bacterium]
MKASAIAIHAVKVFDYWLSIGKMPRAVRAFVVEPLPNHFFVFLTVDSELPVLGDSPAQFVEEHANDLIRNVRLGPSGRGS